MKTFLTLAFLFIAVSAIAAPPDVYIFKAMTSATPVTCSVWGAKSTLNKDANGYVAQGHAPDKTFRRVYSLGTKSYRNHSTAGQASISFTCVNTGTGTAAPVRIYMDALDAYYFTTDSATWVIGR